MGWEGAAIERVEGGVVAVSGGVDGNDGRDDDDGEGGDDVDDADDEDVWDDEENAVDEEDGTDEDGEDEGDKELEEVNRAWRVRVSENGQGYGAGVKDAVFVDLFGEPKYCNRENLANPCHALCCDSYFIHSWFCHTSNQRCVG